MKLIANRERYPGFAPDFPDVIDLSECSDTAIERILRGLEYTLAGSGCDHFYLREDEP